MKEHQILDQEESLEQPLTRDPIKKTLIYTVVMLCGGMLVYAYLYRTTELLFLLFCALGLMIICAFISLILEAIRLFMRKRKERRTGIKVLSDPFWFEVLEGSFSIWILLTVVVLLGRLLA